MTKIRFLSSNQNKIDEVKAIMEPQGFEVVPIIHKIEELQTIDVDKLIKDKCLKSFRYSGRPIFVEHTGLYMNSLNDFPAGLTQIFWDKLKADNVTKFFGDQVVVAKTVIGYCDGRKIRTFDGEISGKISEEPKGDRTFQWDCVFIPDGKKQTFAEMDSQEKNKISMRSMALNKFVDYLKGLQND